MRFMYLGASGPRVVGLQILLNRFKRCGVPLRVDGIFGLRTARAVREWRAEARRSRTSGGGADSALWDTLLHRHRLKTVESPELAGRLYSEVRLPAARTAPPPAFLIGGAGNGIESLLEAIRFRAGASGQVALLRFRSAELAPRPRHVGFHLEMAILNEVIAGKLRPAFDAIAPVFANFGSVEFDSWMPGFGGAVLLQALADVWKVPVSAPSAPPTPIGAPARGPAFRTFYPNRITLRQWAESREDAAALNRRHAFPRPVSLPVTTPIRVQ